MPVVTAAVVTDRAYVYVETDWSDVPAAVYVCVDRVDTTTGERFPLRSYVSYDDNGCLALSCGLGIFWDTEAPFDTPLQYCATVVNAAGNVVTTSAPNLVTATFSAVAVASWPPADTGQTFTNSGGAAADYSGTGSRGQQATVTTGTARISSVPVSHPNLTAVATSYPTAVALTQALESRLWLRADAAGNNGYRVRVRYNTAATVDVVLERVVAGVATTLATALAIAPYVAGSGFRVMLRAWGTTLSAKVWDATTPEPAAFTVTATDTVFTGAGTVNLASFRTVGNTNGTVNMQWDDLAVTDVCADPIPLEVCSNTVTIANDGCFRLGDPVNPCNDRRVCLATDECEDPEGIFFSSIGPEVYADESGQFLPVNGRRPVVVSRERRDETAVLTVVTATFDDRDDVLALNQPGTPLLWRGPASYGTGDRYMSVQDVAVTRSFSDHQEEPRVVTMPFSATDAPVGPSNGICGARVDDLCDVYPTWDALIAGGLTYADLLRGAAGTGGPVIVFETWNSVNADFLNWNALNAGRTNWINTALGV